MTHGYFLTLAYGVSGLLLAAEALLLWRRCVQARRLHEGLQR